MSKTRLRGTEKLDWDGAKGEILGLQYEINYFVRGVAFSMKDEWFEKMSDCKCSSTRSIIVKFKCERL